jgi:hypothetical protein
MSIFSSPCSLPFRTKCAISLSGALLLIAGCASSPAPSPTPTPGPTGNTRATLLITATNNAKIAVFKFNIQSVTLVSATGTLVPILTAPQLVELGSLNGVAHPLVTANISQGTYTAVKLTYSPSTFVVIDRSGGPNTIDAGNYNITTPQSQPAPAELTLTTPLTVTGSAMGLLLDLNIPKSTTYTPYLDGSPALAPGGGQVTFNPVFSFSGITPAATPGTLQDGKVEDIHGQVTGESGNLLTITSNTGATFNFTTSSSSTIFAGPSISALFPSSFVDIDATLQPDGSMLATNVQTEAQTQKYDIVGQILQYPLSVSPLIVQNVGSEQQGPNLPNGTGFIGSNNAEFASSAQFEIAWPTGTPPVGLPFTPTLNANLIVPGQNLVTPVDSLEETNDIVPTTSLVTLEPQTINATVVAVSTANGQTSYQVNLAPDDLITLFGPGQQVVVHTTAATHNIATLPLTSGSIARFRGLLFNDGGTLRMVATTIEDGVPIS